MFVGALNPTPRLVGRLREWTQELWPGHHQLGEGTDCRLFTTADLGVLEKRQLETPELLLAIDGWIWRDGADGCTWGALDALAEQLVAAGGWPLGSAWDGSFACCAFDKRSGTLSLALDAVGWRRLFYGRDGSSLVFGNVQGACAHALGLEPDLASLAQWLGAGYVPGRKTLFAGLEEVMVGERRRFSRDGAELDSAVDCPWHDAMEALPADVAAGRIAPLLERYARRFAARLPDGRGALALSGGMDSRLVLGALGEQARGLRTYTYGGAGDREAALALRCARAAGAEPSVIDLSSKYFPSQQALRRRALLGEAIAFPFWHHLDEAAETDGVETILIGDIANFLNVYIKPLRGRDERVRRAFRRLTLRPESFDENPMSPESWLRGEIDRTAAIACRLAQVVGLEVGDQEISRAVEAGYQELHQHLGARPQSLFCLQEKFFLAIEREAAGGSQVVSLAGSREVIPIFSTRKLVGVGFNVGFASRTRRALIDAVARRVLAPEIRRVPTATIPLASIDAPKWSQEAMWFLRWLGDASMGALSRRAPKLWPRDRLFRTLSLRPEFERAMELGYAEPWAVSGVFSSYYWQRRVRRSASGERPASVPMAEMRALAADSILAAARYGPAFLHRLGELPRR